MAINWQGAGQGALGGVAAGASLGPLGAAAGGVLGGVLGMFGGDPQSEYRKQLEAYGQMVKDRPAPQAGYSDFRANQSDLVKALEAQAAGQGPSLARAQLDVGLNKAANQAAGLASSARGPNQALSMFQAQQTAANLGGQANEAAMM